MPTITSLRARQILDSRGHPTVEAECELNDGSFGRSAVPSGASTGSHEALELRDGDKKLYGGKSVLKAVTHVNGTIATAMVGKDVADQRIIDGALIALDGTDMKNKLGANAILGVSMAVCRARAVSEKLPLYRSLATQFSVKETGLLPVPMMNVMNGGKHADSGLSLQECMIVPVGFSRFSDALRAGVEVFMTLKKLLHDAGHITAVGDEGGFAPRVKDSAEAFGFLAKAIDEAGYGGTVKLAIDAAQLAQKNGWRTIISHRSGETEDTFIADLAVALGTGQIKTGSASRTDRVCKYNQLLRIEEELGGKARNVSPFSDSFHL